MSSKLLLSAISKAQLTLRSSKTVLFALLAGVVVSQTAMAASYRLSVQRVGQNFYSISDSSMLLQTKNCYVQANGASGELTMTSSLGIQDGRLAFDSGTSCDVVGAFAPAENRSTSSTASLTYLEAQYFSDSTQATLIRTSSNCLSSATAAPAQITLSTPGRAYAGGATVGTVSFFGASPFQCEVLGVYGLLDLTQKWPGPYIQILSLLPVQVLQTKATYVASIPAVGTATWVLLDGGAATPVSSQVLAGLDANSKLPIQTNTETIDASQNAVIALRGLIPGKNYRLCVAGKDSFGNTTQTSCSSFTPITTLMDPVLRPVPDEYINTLVQFPFFNLDFYLLVNADVAKVYGVNDMGGYWHWLNNGIGERRLGSVFFDESWYLQKHPDLIVAFGGDTVGAAIHFATVGLAEGRESSPAFSLPVYRANNPDLVRAFGNNNLAYYRHFNTNGAKECRIASNNFDPTYYMAVNQDVWQAYKGNCADALIHWHVKGRAEGRQAAPNQKPLPPR